MIDKKTLENGKVLAALEMQFRNAPTDQNFKAVLVCLADSEVWVPMNAQLSAEDIAQLANVKAGDKVTTKGDIHMRPDILQRGEEFFFPMFSQKEQAPADYAGMFSWVKLPVRKCISMARATEKVHKMILDAYSFQFVLDENLMQVVDEVAEAREGMI